MGVNINPESRAKSCGFSKKWHSQNNIVSALGYTFEEPPRTITYPEIDYNKAEIQQRANFSGQNSANLSSSRTSCKSSKGQHETDAILRRAAPLSTEELAALYRWVDGIPFSRPKRNISRDFSDGVLMAELVNYCAPKLVDSHNYSSANSISQKKYNWKTLNRRVFNTLGINLHVDDIEDIVQAKPYIVERIINLFRKRLGSITFALNSRKTQKNRETGSYSNNKWESQLINSCSQIAEFETYHDDNDIFHVKSHSKTERELQLEMKLKEMKSVNDLLSEKIHHLEQLIKIKDAKLNVLSKQFTSDNNVFPC